MNTTTLSILVMSLAALSATAGAASAMPAAPLNGPSAAATQVQYRDDDGWRRPRVTVYPDRYFSDYSNYYPRVRGFEDRNPVPRGNMRGCTVDLGYGRYESCDKQ